MSSLRLAATSTLRSAAAPSCRTASRTYATVSSQTHKHKVVIVGGGTAGITAAAQLRRSTEAGKLFGKDDIAIIEPAEQHHYQPGWTLVGTGLKSLNQMSTSMESVIPSGVKHYPLRVANFSPETNTIKTAEGIDLEYDYLIVAPGLKTDFSAVKGLQDALDDPTSLVSSVYSEKTVEQTWKNIQAMKSGTAMFTQPAGVIKCAGAPQKVLWMALSQWKKDGVRDAISPVFATGAPSMFAVPKYAKALEQLRVERNVEGLFQHNLTSIDYKNRTATFKNLAAASDNKEAQAEVQRDFGFLHVVPPQKPHEFVATSPLADAAGWVSVDQKTTRHTKYNNVFSIGDASSLPNSKTAAAISGQVPVLVDNLLATANGVQPLKAAYDGYASCPLLTGHNELMLCEFKYGGVPKETFSGVLGSQDKPRAAYYYLKKDIFPTVYFNSFLKGTWYGPNAFFRPDTTAAAAPQ